VSAFCEAQSYGARKTRDEENRAKTIHSSSSKSSTSEREKRDPISKSNSSSSHKKAPPKASKNYKTCDVMCKSTVALTVGVVATFAMCRNPIVPFLL